MNKRNRSRRTHLAYKLPLRIPMVCILMLLIQAPYILLHAQDPEPPALPTPEQLQWHDMELTMFVHFAPNTWQGQDLDDHSTPLERINPSKLDVHQWIDAAELLGARMILFVAKHVGGFCWWQTETSDYSIKNTPYKDGRGDLLKELSEACWQRGMKLGIYIYPGDRTWGAYLGGGGRTRDPSKQEGYNAVLRKQWEETLSSYGPVTENADGVWLKTLTCSLTNNAWRSCGERATGSGTTTRRPPYKSAPQISHTETSKL